LTQIGTKKYKYDEFAEMIFLNTGKFNVNVKTQADPLNPNDPNGYIMITMAC